MPLYSQIISAKLSKGFIFQGVLLPKVRHGVVLDFVKSFSLNLTCFETIYLYMKVVQEVSRLESQQNIFQAAQHKLSGIQAELEVGIGALKEELRDVAVEHVLQVK